MVYNNRRNNSSKYGEAVISAKVFLLALTILASLLSSCTAAYFPGVGSITKSITNNLNPDGSYNFGFDTSNDIKREEKGSFENGIWTVRGFVSWLSPDNKIRGYEYTADDKGYQQIDMEPQDGDTRTDPKTKAGLLG